MKQSVNLKRKKTQRERTNKEVKTISINPSGKIEEKKNNSGDYEDSGALYISGTSLLKALYLFAEREVKEMTGHEKAILLAHFDTDGKSSIDVDEFMDSLRPALNQKRQDVVDSIFASFQSTESDNHCKKKLTR